jgi:hypothetical protein
VREYRGYGYIPQRFARVLIDYCGQRLNPDISFHRLHLFAEMFTDPKGC